MWKSEGQNRAEATTCDNCCSPLPPPPPLLLLLPPPPPLLLLLLLRSPPPPAPPSLTGEFFSKKLKVCRLLLLFCSVILFYGIIFCTALPSWLLNQALSSHQRVKMRQSGIKGQEHASIPKNSRGKSYFLLHPFAVRTLLPSPHTTAVETLVPQRVRDGLTSPT